MKNQITIPKKRYDEMIFADAINYAHDLVEECGELYLPHRIEAHNAIDMIVAEYKSELQAHVKNFESTINNLTAENARLKAVNAKMREALLIIAEGKDARWNYEEVAFHMVQWAKAALAAEGGEK